MIGKNQQTMEVLKEVFEDISLVQGLDVCPFLTSILLSVHARGSEFLLFGCPSSSSFSFSNYKAAGQITYWFYHFSPIPTMASGLWYMLNKYALK